MDYNKQLDNLFIRWMESLDEERRNLFCKDGLMLKADKPEEYVDERWNKMQRRVMFLVKDKNTPEGDDTRRWSLDENMCKLSGGNVGRTGFFPNIARIFYGLQVITADNNGVGADELTKDKKNEVLQVWNTEPFAFVEAKKVAGHSCVSSEEVTKAMQRDKEFLKEEIDILRPNIILCCDAGDSQFNFITSEYFAGKEAEKIEYTYPLAPHMKCCLWYYPDDCVAVIKSYHPTRTGKQGDWVIYERVISPFRKLVTNHKI
ncbi:MAG: hypothetical protein IKQ68_01285 [Prevotella sp.]|nr:hypothetical protein [Prevotella sp.]